MEPFITNHEPQNKFMEMHVNAMLEQFGGMNGVTRIQFKRIDGYDCLIVHKNGKCYYFNSGSGDCSNTPSQNFKVINGMINGNSLAGLLKVGPEI